MLTHPACRLAWSPDSPSPSICTALACCSLWRAPLPTSPSCPTLAPPMTHTICHPGCAAHMPCTPLHTACRCRTKRLLSVQTACRRSSYHIHTHTLLAGSTALIPPHPTLRHAPHHACRSASSRTLALTLTLTLPYPNPNHLQERLIAYQVHDPARKLEAPK